MAAFEVYDMLPLKIHADTLYQSDVASLENKEVCRARIPNIQLEDACQQLVFWPCMMHGRRTDLPGRFPGLSRHGG